MLAFWTFLITAVHGYFAKASPVNGRIKDILKQLMPLEKLHYISIGAAVSVASRFYKVEL